MTEQHTHDEVGTLAEEALALFGAVAGWMRESAAGPHPGAETSTEQPDPAGPGDPSGEQGSCAGSCRWCPVCRAAETVRQVSPEVRAHLVDAGTSLLAALGGLLAAPGQQHPDRASDTDSEPRVQRIRLDGEE